MYTIWLGLDTFTMYKCTEPRGLGCSFGEHTGCSYLIFFLKSRLQIILTNNWKLLGGFFFWISTWCTCIDISKKYVLYMIYNKIVWTWIWIVQHAVCVCGLCKCDIVLYIVCINRTKFSEVSNVNKVNVLLMLKNMHLIQN